jgi:hypothetical protein
MAKSDDKRRPDLWLEANGTLTSGITKVDGTLPIARVEAQWSADGIRYRTQIRVNRLRKAIASDAALGFGEHIATFPKGLIRPVGGLVVLNSLCPTGLSATAGEVGLGSTVASGAVATLGGTVGFENLMEGTTLANHVAATPLVSRKANDSVVRGTQGALGPAVLDGSANAVKVHLNVASTWDQTAGESVTFGGVVILDWEFVGTGAEA